MRGLVLGRDNAVVSDVGAMRGMRSVSDRRGACVCAVVFAWLRRWYVSEDAARAYGVSAEDYKKKERNKHEKGSKSASNAPSKNAKLTTAKTPHREGEVIRVHIAASPGRANDHGPGEEGGGRRKGQAELSESAHRLFEMAMGSEEFKEMMRLYTGALLAARDIDSSARLSCRTAPITRFARLLPRFAAFTHDT